MLFIDGRYISFETNESLKTCSYYKFVQQNPQLVNMN